MNNVNNDVQEEDYVLVGKDLSGLWLQPGFVEGVVRSRQVYSSLHDSFADIFGRNMEYAVVLWNAVPVKLSYREDLPLMVGGIISMLDAVVGGGDLGRFEWKIDTPNIKSVWQIAVEAEQVWVDSDWQEIAGGYERALNRLSMIHMSRRDFSGEWKMLLQQFIHALDDAAAKFTVKPVKDQVKRLRKINAAIPSRGRFYQY